MMLEMSQARAERDELIAYPVQPANCCYYFVYFVHTHKLQINKTRPSKSILHAVRSNLVHGMRKTNEFDGRILQSETELNANATVAWHVPDNSRFDLCAVSALF